MVSRAAMAIQHSNAAADAVPSGTVGTRLERNMVPIINGRLGMMIHEAAAKLIGNHWITAIGNYGMSLSFISITSDWWISSIAFN